MFVTSPVNRIDPSGYGWLKDKLNQAKEAVTKVVEKTKEVVTKVVETVKETTTKVVNTVTTAVKNTYNTVKTWFNNTKQTVSNVIDNIGDKVDNAVTGFKEVMPSSLEEAGDMLGNALSQVGESIGTPAKKIYRGVVELYEAIEEKFCSIDEPKDVTRIIGDELIANPLAVYLTQNKEQNDLVKLGFLAAGFFQDSSGVYHTYPKCWQRIGGYNDFYDVVFDYATSMDAAKFPFTSGGADYTIWAWRGDYLNLGAGAELGIYQDVFGQFGMDVEHLFVNRNLSMPMTLNLTDTQGNLLAEYSPENPQWWITSFNPYEQEYTINFTGNEEMYNDFYRIYSHDERWDLPDPNDPNAELIATFIFKNEGDDN